MGAKRTANLERTSKVRRQRSVAFDVPHKWDDQSAVAGYYNEHVFTGASWICCVEALYLAMPVERPVPVDLCVPRADFVFSVGGR